MEKATALVIFCDDFRTKDNPALYNACQNYEKVAALYIYDENYLGRPLGSAAKVFLHHVLNSFQKELKKSCSLDLILRKGESFKELQKIVKEINPKAIYFNHSYSKAQIDYEGKIKETYRNLDVQSFRCKTLFEPDQIKTGAGEPFKVYTPFSKACLKNVDLIGEFLKIKEAKFNAKAKSLKIDDLDLLPPKKEGGWAKNMIKYWQFDYEKLYAKIGDFLDQKVAKYGDDRNMLAKDGTSKISPYLRFGMVSPRMIYHAAIHRKDHQKFFSQILWREFAYHTLYNFPNIDKNEIHASYGNFKWANDKKEFDAWKRGETGFDIVDAGMKEIYETGSMHNRSRMVVASFLIKDLLIDWKKGEQYFWDCLVDADPAINPFSWQWVFGSGFDAAPYFRVFNPDLQEKRFDPKHEYCDKWLGEGDRPIRIVDHSQRRDIVLMKYKERLKG